MKKNYYVFFVRDELPRRSAEIAQTVQSANAAANLGYPAVLVFLRRDWQAFNPLRWLQPWTLEEPDASMIRFYNLEKAVKVVRLAMPFPIDRIKGKLFSSSTAACRYYFPRHIFPRTQLIHTREWNLVKAAVRSGIPAIYERDHYEYKPYEPDVVNSPHFQLAVAVADTVRDNMLQQGMPPEKTVKIHNGFNRLFLTRDSVGVETWRQQLLTNGRKYLVVYAGSIYRFKGIDLLLEIVKDFPDVQFVMAGGPTEQSQAYQQVIQARQLQNVKLLGFLTQTQIASLLQAADALAHPHLSGKAADFTSPMKFFEYMASGVPIVASVIPPLREFTSIDLPVGWCETDNPAQFAEALRRVLATYPRRPEGYSQGNEFVQQFSWENRIINILSHVDSSWRPLQV